MSQGSAPVLRSYTGGAWRTGSGEGVPLHDAVTGETVARVSSAGIDMAGALEHGRRAGGPALRELGGIVAHGYLLVSLAAGLFVAPEPGPVLANYGLENLRFLTPVKPGDELTVTLTAKQITPREDAGYGEVRWDADVTNDRGESVAKYDVLTLVAKERTP